MQRNGFLAIALLGVCLGGGIGAQCSLGNGSADLRAALVATGVDPDASGQAWSLLSSIVAQLQVDTTGLAPNTVYVLAVDGTPAASFATDAQGRGTVTLGSQDPQRKLDFDPRGREIEIRHGLDDVLRVTMDAGGASGKAGVEVVTLLASDFVGAGKAVARVRTTADGRQKFSVEVQRAPAGPYTLFVDGVERGTLAAPGGFGEIEFDTKPDDVVSHELPLTFAVENAQIDLVLGGELAFGGMLRAGVPTVNRCEPLEILRPLAGAGEAKARLRVRDDCDRDFEVEIEHVAAGSYGLLVGGVERGTIVAAFDPARGKVRGELEFDSDPDEADELLLDFDPLGARVEVRAGSQVAFSIDPFVAGPGIPVSCTPEESIEDLFAGTAQPLASGKSRLRVRDGCRSDLSVEIEDVTAGSYEVLIAGAVRGTIVAAFDPAKGQVRGEIEFGDDSPGSPALDFDPRGQAIDVVQGATLVLSTTFVGGGGGVPSCVDASQSVALLNQGVDGNAHANARLRIRDDCRKTFTVEIEDVAAGSYQLLVDGVAEATFAVGALGQGEIELDSHDAPKPVLSFDPRGREIAIARGATVLFLRVFPE